MGRRSDLGGLSGQAFTEMKLIGLFLFAVWLAALAASGQTADGTKGSAKFEL